ncbi:hypothetical protein ASZ90_019621 [hydrocarbon metagenome]|uniref:Uncharacterized protein n=1 Tax=hydrocarbon metagenome TaxID=938273 RepID=A0A0W8E3M6_9ZZZZ
MIAGPIILLGFLKLTDKRVISTKVLLSFLISFIFLTVAVHLIILEFNLGEPHLINAVGLLFMNTPCNVYLATLVAIVAFRLMFLSLTKNNDKIIISIIFIAGLFFFTGQTITRSVVAANQEKMQIVKIVDLIATSEEKLPVYFLWDDQNDPSYSKWDNRNTYDRLIADCYQFLLLEEQIKIVNDEELRQAEGAKFVLSAEFYHLFDLMHDYKFCMSTANSYLLASNTSSLINNSFDNNYRSGINLSLGQFDLTNAVANESFIQNNATTPGIFMEGPYRKLNKGHYVFLLDMQLVSYKDEELGYADVYSSINEDVLNLIKINISHFNENNSRFLEVPFELARDEDYIGLRLYANKGTQFKINNVYIQRQQE